MGKSGQERKLRVVFSGHGSIVSSLLLLAMMMVLPPVSMTTTVQSACQLPPACTCSSFPGGDVDNCYVRAVDVSEPTIAALPPDMTAVQLTCMAVDSLSKLTWGLFRHVTRMQRISLHNCHFAAVQPNVFQHVGLLQSLEIVNCHFSGRLPTDLFNPISRLSFLSLTGNNLIEIPSLCGLSQLERLNLSHQPLPLLDTSVMRCDEGLTFQELTVLDISNTSLTTLPQILIKKAPNLRELYAGQNQMHVVSFAPNLSLARLQLLDLHGNQLHSVDFLTHLPLTQMSVVRLQGSGCCGIAMDTVLQLHNVSDLRLDNLDIDDAVWDALPALTNLKVLSLAGNRLSNVSFASSGHAYLQELNLAGNRIGKLDDLTFAHMRELCTLDLSWNWISKIYDNVFSHLTSLTSLNLQNNNLTFITAGAFSNLSSLEFLFLDNNSLTSLSPYFLKGMTSLRELHVSGNRLALLPNFWDLRRLSVVNANHNQLTDLFWSVFRRVDSLEFLFLRNNSLRYIRRSVLGQLPLLRMLDLRNNSIEKLDLGVFGNLPTLSAVRLDYNLIQQFGEVVTSMTSLQWLSLDSNYLTQLTTNMFPSSLKYLSVTNNWISYLEPSLLMSLPQLKILHLGENWNLKTLDIRQVQVPPSLLPKPAVLLGPNLFACDCHLAYLRAWADHRKSVSVLRDHLPDFEDLQVLFCSTHFSQTPVPFHSVPLAEFVCPYKEPICDVSCGCCSASDDTSEPHPNCTCVLTCPENCTCYTGGSEFVSLFHHVICSSRGLSSVPEGVPCKVTHLRLDGNNVSILHNDPLIHLTDLIVLHLNNSMVRLVQAGTFRSLVNLTWLDLSHNYLEQVSRHTFGNLPRLTHLYLHDNHIHVIETGAFGGLGMLQTLTLHQNLIRHLDGIADLMPATLLTLADNPWPCDCDLVRHVLKFFSLRNRTVADRDRVRCFWHEAGSEIMTSLAQANGSLLQDATRVPLAHHPGTFPDAAPSYSLLLADFQLDVLCTAVPPVVHEAHFLDNRTHLAAIASMLVVVAVVLAVGGLVVWRRREVQALVFVRLGVRLWDEVTPRLDGAEDDVGTGQAAQHRHFDAFVSYSHLDEDFVSHVLVPHLEQKTARHYRLCVHYRDFPVGAAIATTILESIQASKRTLLVLSENFLDSEWCLFEFRTALHHVLQTDAHRLVPILLSELPAHRVDSDLKLVLTARTHLKTSDPWFWEKLYFALPDVTSPHTLPTDPAPDADEYIAMVDDPRPENGAMRCDDDPSPEKSDVWHDVGDPRSAADGVNPEDKGPQGEGCEQER